MSIFHLVASYASVAVVPGCCFSSLQTASRTMRRWGSLRRAFLQPYQDHAKLLQKELDQRRRLQQVAVARQDDRSSRLFFGRVRGNQKTRVAHSAHSAGSATSSATAPSIPDTVGQSPQERGGLCSPDRSSACSLVQDFKEDTEDGEEVFQNTPPVLMLRFLPKCGPNAGPAPFLLDTHLLLAPEWYRQSRHWMAHSRLRAMLARIQRDYHRLRRRLQEDCNTYHGPAGRLSDGADDRAAGVTRTRGQGLADGLVNFTAAVCGAGTSGGTEPCRSTSPQPDPLPENCARAAGHSNLVSTAEEAEEPLEKSTTSSSLVDGGAARLGACQESLLERRDCLPGFRPRFVSSIAPWVLLAPEAATAIEACVKLQFLPCGLMLRLACHFSSAVGQVSVALITASPAASLGVPFPDVPGPTSVVDREYTEVSLLSDVEGRSTACEDLRSFERNRGTRSLERGYAAPLTARAWAELEQLLGWLNKAVKAAVFSQTKAIPDEGGMAGSENDGNEEAEASEERRSTWRTFEECYR